MKLSLIICVYNTDVGLLDECLRSLSESTLEEGEREIIIIDDGSENDVGSLAKKHRAHYERLAHVGTLAARLRGIELASGEYLAFVDSDDTVGFNYHLPMLKKAEEGYDIVFNAWAFRTKSTTYFCKDDDTLSGGIFSDEPLATFFSRGGRQHSYYVLWNKLFRTEVLRLARREILTLDLPSHFCFSEDTLINLYAFKSSKRVASVKTDFYFYRIHENQTVCATTRERLLHQIDCMSYTLDRCYAEAKKIGGDAPLLVDGWRALMARSHYAHARALGATDISKYASERYGISDLTLPTRLDGALYERVRILPPTLPQIEKALLCAYKRSRTLRFKPVRRNSIARVLADGLLMIGASVEWDSRYPALPNERIPLIKRMLFSPALRRLGAVLFKKGSPIRAFLKRFI